MGIDITGRTDAVVKTGLELAIDNQEKIGDLVSIQSSASEIDGVVSTTSMYVTPEQFGADGTKANDSKAIRDAIATGKVVRLGKKRYYYDGTAITNDFVAIEGAIMPRVNSDYTSLENGTIIEGKFFCSGSIISLQNFGVDVGSGTTATEDDGLKCTSSLNAGKSLYLKNIVSLIKNESSIKHSILLEGYQNVYGENITGIHGYFGFIVKCQNVVLNNISTEKNSSDGLYIKSDNNFGKSKNILINGIRVDGKGTQTNGIRVQADTDIVENIVIKNIDVKDCSVNVLVQSLNASIKNIYLSGISRNPITKSCYIAGSASIIYNVNINDFISYDTNDTGIQIGNICSNVSLNDIDIKYKDTVTAVELAKGIIVSAETLVTTADNVQISNSNNLGTIVYNNAQGLNTIGYYKCKLGGSGKPQDGLLSVNVSGTAATITPNYNHKDKQLIVRVNGATSPTNVTSISKYKYGTEMYETGTKLTIINSGSNPLYINHNYGGNILNKSSANALIDANTASEWVFGGAVWHQVV